MTVNPKDLSDDVLSNLSDALLAEHLRREHLSDLITAAKVGAMTRQELNDLRSLLSDEIMLRAERDLDIKALHEIDQGEAAEDAGVTHRCARLFRMARLNAPDAIIMRNLELVIRSAPVRKVGQQA